MAEAGPADGENELKSSTVENPSMDGPTSGNEAEEPLQFHKGTAELKPRDLEAELRAKDEELRAKEAQIVRLGTTLQHWRTWNEELSLRYGNYNSDITRPSKRIYIGGLPADVQDNDLRQFFNQLLADTKGAASLAYPILSCKLYPEKNYAFVEFRTVEEASNCMALDGVQYRNTHLRVRRPNNYQSHIAAVLGPQVPDPSMDLSGLKIIRTVVPDTPSKLFIGGLPCDWTEDQVKELVQPHANLRAFNLVMDKNTGNSKGYAFAELMDITKTDFVVQALNGKPVGNKFLTVKRALTASSYVGEGIPPEIPQGHRQGGRGG